MAEAKPKQVTQAELARLLGVSRTAVNKAVKAGRITADADGRFDLEQAIIDWKNNTRAAAKAASQPGSPRQRGGQPKYASARARKEHSLANIAEMREGQMRGALAETASVKDAGTEVGTTVRTVLENLADQLAPVLAAESEEHNVHRILSKQMDTALHDIVARLESVIREITDEPPRRNGGSDDGFGNSDFNL